MTDNPLIEEHFSKLIQAAEDSVIAIYTNNTNDDREYVVMASASNGDQLFTNSGSTMGRARHLASRYFDDLLNLHSSHNIHYVEVPEEDIESTGVTSSEQSMSFRQ